MLPITPSQISMLFALKERDDIDVTTEGYSMINPMALIEFNTKEGPFVDPPFVAPFRLRLTAGL